jgi:hypothetical protein
MGVPFFTFRNIKEVMCSSGFSLLLSQILTQYGQKDNKMNVGLYDTLTNTNFKILRSRTSSSNT